MNWLSSKYNRCNSLRLSFQNNVSELNIFYNKNNLYTAFNVDQTTYIKTKKAPYHNIIFFDVNKSLFCKTFLDIRSFNTNTIDIRNQYNSIFPYHRDIIRCELDETCILSKHKVTWSKIPQENSISIRAFRLSLYEDDFFYILVERQLIDPVIHKKIIRSSAYQVGNEDASNYISAAAAKYNTKEIKKETTEEALKSVFSNTAEDHKNDLKLERCGVL